MAQINARSDIDHAVIDNLRRYSWVMDQMTFDDAVTPGAGGATLTYGFTLLKTARGASFRPIGSEYTPAEAAREHRTVQLRPRGGSVQEDRVLANLGPAAPNAVGSPTPHLLAGATAALRSGPSARSTRRPRLSVSTGPCSSARSAAASRWTACAPTSAPRPPTRSPSRCSSSWSAPPPSSLTRRSTATPPSTSTVST